MISGSISRDGERWRGLVRVWGEDFSNIELYSVHVHGEGFHSAYMYMYMLFKSVRSESKYHGSLNFIFKGYCCRAMK